MRHIPSDRRGTVQSVRHTRQGTQAVLLVQGSAVRLSAVNVADWEVYSVGAHVDKPTHPPRSLT